MNKDEYRVAVTGSLTLIAQSLNRLANVAEGKKEAPTHDHEGRPIGVMWNDLNKVYETAKPFINLFNSTAGRKS